MNGFLVSVNKAAVAYRFSHIYWKSSLNKNQYFWQWFRQFIPQLNLFIKEGKKNWVKIVSILSLMPQKIVVKSSSIASPNSVLTLHVIEQIKSLLLLLEQGASRVDIFIRKGKNFCQIILSIFHIQEHRTNHWTVAL